MFFNRRAFIIGAASSLASPAVAKENEIGFILVGASWCPVCKVAAPMLAVLAENSGIPVLVASQDSRPIPPFEKFTPIADHPLVASVQRYPTTFVFSSKANALVGGVEGYRSPTWYVSNLKAVIREAMAL